MVQACDSLSRVRATTAAVIALAIGYAALAGDKTPATESVTEGPPRVVAAAPAPGATDVDPATSEIIVTFDRDMAGGFSWTGGGPDYPPLVEGQKPHWTEDMRTCVLPVRLAPDHQYRLGLNSPSHRNFQSAAGVPLDPVSYTFRTGQ